MRATVFLFTLILVATAFAVSSSPVSAQDGLPRGNPATAQAALPVLNYLSNDEVCTSWVEVQNVGANFTRVALIVWGAPGFCPPQCAGPLKVECSGLLKPGSSWNFLGAQVPSGSKSGQLFSMSAATLADAGLDDDFGYDDIIADVLCETLFFGVVGDCDDYRRFKMAYDQGLSFAGLPMDIAVGEPIAAEVLRRCTGPDQPNTITSKYRAIPAVGFGRFDEVFGGYAFYAPLLYANVTGFESTLYLQNSGLDCTTVEIWFQQQDACLRPLICEVFTLAPGETFQYAASDCVGPGWIGSAWFRTSQPMAVTIDHVGRGLLMSYSATPSQLRTVFNGDPVYTPGSKVAYGPLVYSEYQGWDTGIQVQNLSATHSAKAKVYFLDRSGDIVTTLVDWVCPRGSQTFYLPAVTDLPGNWVGSVRVESQDWFTPGGPKVNASPITAVAHLIKYADIQRTSTNEAIAYNLLTEPEAYTWQIGAGSGGTESGTALIAVPSLLKDLNGTGVTTELAIANFVPKPGFTDFAIYVYDMNGLIDFVCQKLNEKQVEYIDLQTWGYLAPGFKGSAVISATFWEHDVFDAHGNFVRNLVGLGAVTIERAATSLGTNVPGDQSGGSLAIPIAGPFDFEGPEAPRCPGQPNPTPGTCPRSLVLEGPPIDLADPGTVDSTIELTYNIPARCLVEDVNVQLDIDHGDVGDLSVFLEYRDPQGANTHSEALFTEICAGSNDVRVTLDDDDPLSNGTLGAPGSCSSPVGQMSIYATESGTALGTFDGGQAKGDWTLTVIDDAFGDAGRLNGWQIRVDMSDPLAP